MTHPANDVVANLVRLKDRLCERARGDLADDEQYTRNLCSDVAGQLGQIYEGLLNAGRLEHLLCHLVNEMASLSSVVRDIDRRTPVPKKMKKPSKPKRGKKPKRSRKASRKKR